ncbi:MAG: hypothetical protein IJT59_07415 [Desulfovibrionaceae bacterium]|nr:hypothetical protein [Desulfovibrionaceae bacterium]
MQPSKFILTALLALGLFAATQVNAAEAPQPGPNVAPCAPCGNHPGMPAGPCFGGPGAAHKMITPEQRQKYYAIMKEFAPKMQSIRDQLFIQGNLLQALKHSSQPDLAKVEETSKAILKLRAEKRELQKAIDDKLAKECGIVKPAKPIPGVDVPPRPFRGFHGPEHFHHGPMGPMGCGPMHD